jgi:hypothetical protein
MNVSDFEKRKKSGPKAGVVVAEAVAAVAEGEEARVCENSAGLAAAVAAGDRR